MTDQRADDLSAVAPEYHEYVVVGAGVCGLYAVHRLRSMGGDVIALEAHEGLGGTWHKNRYPGCRFDSESYTYGYSFSQELLQEWDWSEEFAAQPETRRYLLHVAEKFDLKPSIRFNARVRSATFQEPSGTWLLLLEDGRRFESRFLLTALGLLSAPVVPRIPGIGSFRGTSFHTYEWPEELEVADKRVGVIGTGSTGVQIIAAIAPEVSSLHVFQLQPNWCAPLNNRPIEADRMAQIKASYDEIFAKCSATPGGFIHGPVPEPFDSVSPEDRIKLWENLYGSPGFGIWLGNFREILMDEEANLEFSEFMAGKIRERVDDPSTAERLIPNDHGFGVQRVPMETNYFETFNRPHVHLVDLRETPIESITTEGVLTSEGQIELDVLIYATGFDAITGSYDRIEIRGRDGQLLKEKWDSDGGPQTYLGVGVHGFPNLLMLGGPHSASVATNFPRAIETSVEWVTNLLAYARDNGIGLIDADADAETEWTEHIADLYQRQILRKSKSWFTGYNPNVEDRSRTRYLIYTGGAPRYRKTLSRVRSEGYTGFSFRTS